MRPQRKKILVRVAAGAAALAVLGGLVVASGVVPITASSGHWGVTAWFLNFAKERSVATHALFRDVPLDEPWLVMKGAGHYETGCLPCHGGAGARVPPIPLAMTPHPPRLAERVKHYDAEELFYIVKHGIKFTGMPAWPAQSRDDEVRAVVAFLLTLPGLAEEEYDELVWGELPESAPIVESLGGGQAADVRATLATMCARCHGAEGEGRGAGAFPILAGQRAAYLEKALRAYKSGARKSGIMQPLATALDDDMVAAVARAYAEMTPRLSAEHAGEHRAHPEVAGDDGALGRSIAHQGIPARLVPPCAQCHDGERYPAFPLLHGQYAPYLALQLELFANDGRGGSDFASLMHLPAHALTEPEREAVARHYGIDPPRAR